MFIYLLQTLVLRENAELVAGAKAELKISLILISVVIVGVMGLVSYTYGLNNISRISQEARAFLLCTVQGLTNCDEVVMGVLTEFNRLGDASAIMLAFMPVVMVSFTINLHPCRKDTTATPPASAKASGSSVKVITNQGATN